MKYVNNKNNVAKSFCQILSLLLLIDDITIADPLNPGYHLDTNCDIKLTPQY